MTGQEDTSGTRSPMAIAVKLVRGLSGATRYQREVVRGLGLRRVGATVSRPDTPMTRGMVRRVAHLVRVVEPVQRTDEAELAAERNEGQMVRTEAS